MERVQVARRRRVGDLLGSCCRHTASTAFSAAPDFPGRDGSFDRSAESPHELTDLVFGDDEWRAPALPDHHWSRRPDRHWATRSGPPPRRSGGESLGKSAASRKGRPASRHPPRTRHRPAGPDHARLPHAGDPAAPGARDGGPGPWPRSARSADAAGGSESRRRRPHTTPDDASRSGACISEPEPLASASTSRSGGDQRRDRRVSSPQTLAEGHEVRHNAELRDGSPRAGAARTGQHLVGDEEHLVAIADLPDPAEVVRRRHGSPARRPTHRLGDERRHRLRTLARTIASSTAAPITGGAEWRPTPAFAPIAVGSRHPGHVHQPLAVVGLVVLPGRCREREQVLPW